MLTRLEKRIALVTGGAAGLGKAIALRLVAEGAAVVITDVQRDLGEATAAEGGFTFLHQDVTEEAPWNTIVAEVEARFGGLHILVNNAGILGPMSGATPEDTSLSCWREIFAVNVEGVFLGCRAAIPAMRRTGGGSIINLSSIADRIATPYATAYGASKAAVRQLTTSVAQYGAEQKPRVRCNSVHPGVVRTPLVDKSIAELARMRAISVEEVVRDFVADVPMGEFTLGADIAAAVAFLASDDARHVTGSALLVDGGIVSCNTLRRR